VNRSETNIHPHEPNTAWANSLNDDRKVRLPEEVDEPTTSLSPDSDTSEEFNRSPERAWRSISE
jgi:hypothetical protein